jgi:2-methylaconitate cis-trans-isomerase PrpF
MFKAVPVWIYRGGSSKTVFFHRHDLSRNTQERVSTLPQVMGSPNINQIDGLGC